VRKESAFTLVELLVVIAIIGILAGLLLPSVTKAKTKGHGIQCMNNHRQLTLAWRMYNDDNNDQLLFASPSFTDDTSKDRYTWVLGWMDFEPKNLSNWDVNRDIARSPLWPYAGKSASIWKCPADKSTIVPSSGPFKGRVVPRVRSMSMNLWVGGYVGVDGGLSDGGVWRVYLKANEMIDPGPTRTFLLFDMREDSIDIGNFATDMRGWPDEPGITGFYDFPGSYHNRAGGLSFADGHSEIRRWVDDRTMPPLVKGGLVPDIIASPNNKDVIWLQERCTRKVNP
jgi:prepilin-type N-terminal cleavage/methylation domain-containing protein